MLEACRTKQIQPLAVKTMVAAAVVGDCRPDSRRQLLCPLPPPHTVTMMAMTMMMWTTLMMMQLLLLWPLIMVTTFTMMTLRMKPTTTTMASLLKTMKMNNMATMTMTMMGWGRGGGDAQITCWGRGWEDGARQWGQGQRGGHQSDTEHEKYGKQWHWFMHSFQHPIGNGNQVLQYTVWLPCNLAWFQYPLFNGKVFGLALPENQIQTGFDHFPLV